ncbi:hypothetical protein ATCC90586_006649 [Pythium insidiosum]|nr:hypothetical protein ATCC90586_006649 [Pythium insidiosum]
MPDIPAVRSHPVVRPAGLQVGADKVTLVMGGTAVERSMVTIGSLVICNVRPVGGSAFSRYTLYAVHVQNAITGRSWVVHRRYSEFLAFRELIREHFEQHYDENVDELKSKCQLAAEDSASATCSDTDSQRTLSEHEEPDVDGCPDASALEINKLGVDMLIKQAMMPTVNGASSPSML